MPVGRFELPVPTFLRFFLKAYECGALTAKLHRQLIRQLAPWAFRFAQQPVHPCTPRMCPFCERTVILLNFAVIVIRASKKGYLFLALKSLKSG